MNNKKKGVYKMGNGKMMACIIDEWLCEQKARCPVCLCTHYVADDTSSYLEYVENGPHPSVGKYEGWDDMMELVCNDCIEATKAVFGEGYIMELLNAGENEIVETLAANCKAGLYQK